MSLRDIVAALDAHGIKPAGEGRWMAKCPAHNDRSPSLSVTRGTGGKALVHCHAGCPVESVVSALGLEISALFDETREEVKERLPPDQWPITATYTYENSEGEPVFRVLRRTSEDSGRKTFRQQRFVDGKWLPGLDGVTRVLYGLPRILEAPADAVVFIAEGERDVDALTSLGAYATTNAGGAGNWEPHLSESLRGRKVVILPDNDKAGETHATKVKAALEGIAASVKIVRLPGLREKGDVSDWIGEGGTLAQLVSLAARAEAGAMFVASPERLVGERAERLSNGRELLQFGVQFLDDALVGLGKRDLILIGARTGRGKTQLASIIAMQNCRNGKKVHYFALEAEDREIERRMKFQAIADMYYRDYVGDKIGLRYLDWYHGKLDYVLGRFEAQADEQLAGTLKNLHTYYRIDSFTGEDFARHLDAIREETDLVVLDHFHYVDTEDKDDNRAHKRIVKQIRDGVLRAEKPVVVIGHVRKGDPRNATLLPSEEDFHGSSDIIKIATKAIMLAPDYATETGSSSLFSTYMQIVKCRQEMALTRYVARMNYDIRTDSYDTFYALGRLGDGGREFVGLDREEWPTWKN